MYALQCYGGVSFYFSNTNLWSLFRYLLVLPVLEVGVVGGRGGLQMGELGLGLGLGSIQDTKTGPHLREKRKRTRKRKCKRQRQRQRKRHYIQIQRQIQAHWSMHSYIS